MVFGNDLFSGVAVACFWLALLVFLLLRIEKPAKYYYRLGLKAIDDKDFDAAISHFKNALTKKSDYPRARSALGQLYVEMGDARSAECLIKQNIKQSFELEKSVSIAGKNLLLSKQN